MSEDYLQRIDRRNLHYRIAEIVFQAFIAASVIVLLVTSLRATKDHKDQAERLLKQTQGQLDAMQKQHDHQSRYLRCIAQMFVEHGDQPITIHDLDSCSFSVEESAIAPPVLPLARFNPPTAPPLSQPATTAPPEAVDKSKKNLIQRLAHSISEMVRPKDKAKP